MAGAGVQQHIVLAGVAAMDMDMAMAAVGAVIGLVLDIMAFLLRLTTHRQ
jgi:hypothetical protein